MSLSNALVYLKTKKKLKNLKFSLYSIIGD